ncbi:hypothetical protein QQF64_015635 [Cirrhinus molitorella]|uniref:Uncharacterized protein n=1 Tax=Cirrhinus molitorella TaxID=172907 RepID=A0ABR3NX13_9TELE
MICPEGQGREEFLVIPRAQIPHAQLWTYSGSTAWQAYFEVITVPSDREPRQRIVCLRARMGPNSQNKKRYCLGACRNVIWLSRFSQDETG